MTRCIIPLEAPRSSGAPLPGDCMGLSERFAAFSRRCSTGAGSAAFFIVNLLLTAAWLVWGYLCDWKELWHFVPTTSLTVTTWILTILIIQSQNRDSAALQKKLDELIRALPEADNALRGIEERSGDGNKQ